MRRIATGIVSIALLTFPDLAGAKPDAVPVFNIEPSCQEARSFIGSDKNLAYQACMKDENEARAELARKWTHFKPEDRKDCVAQGATPMPSYVEILTCLEMSAEANALYNPDGSARAKPLPTSQGLSSPQPAAPASNLPGPSCQLYQLCQRVVKGQLLRRPLAIWAQPRRPAMGRIWARRPPPAAFRHREIRFRRKRCNRASPHPVEVTIEISPMQVQRIKVIAEARCGTKKGAEILSPPLRVLSITYSTAWSYLRRLRHGVAIGQ